MPNSPQLNLIAAMSVNHVIGNKNRLPWHLPADWKNFKQVTAGHVFIMGRKSYFNEDALLSDKHNYVISRQTNLDLPDHSTQVGSLAEAIQHCADKQAVFILGGASIFDLAIAQADFLYLTIVHGIFPGDASFPTINWRQWEYIKGQRHLADQQHSHNFAMNIYRRL
ncbi:MAG: dihydrofolate reductase [Bacteroidota bacterium]